MATEETKRSRWGTARDEVTSIVRPWVWRARAARLPMYLAGVGLATVPVLVWAAHPRQRVYPEELAVVCRTLLVALTFMLQASSSVHQRAIDA